MKIPIDYFQTVTPVKTIADPSARAVRSRANNGKTLLAEIELDTDAGLVVVQELRTPKPPPIIVPTTNVTMLVALVKTEPKKV